MKKLFVLFLLVGSLVSVNAQVNTYPTLKITGISIVATDDRGVTGYLINESPVIPSLNDPKWSSTPPLDYTFTTQGTKTLYAWVRDDAGNISDSKSITLIIRLPDVTKPVITDFKISSVSTSLNVPINKFEAKDNDKVVGFKLTETAFISTVDKSWQPTAPKSYTFDSKGTKTLYAWVKDAAGNVSTSVSDTVNIKTKECFLIKIFSFFIRIFKNI